VTDSGGYQVMRVAALRSITDEGVAFQSHLDGARLFLTPEAVVEGQVRLGVDILMPLDECVAHSSDPSVVSAALRRMTAWAERSARVAVGADRHLFGIVQGGLGAALRRTHAEQLAAIEFRGYAVGGLSVGEERGVTREMAAVTAAACPRTDRATSWVLACRRICSDSSPWDTTCSIACCRPATAGTAPASPGGAGSIC